MIYNNKIFLVQIGLYPFRKLNMKQTHQKPIKTQLADYPYHNGRVRQNFLNQNYVGDLEIEFEFWVSKDDDLHSLNKLMYSGELHKVFFLEEYDQFPFYGKHNENKSRYNIYWNYGEIVTPPTLSYTEASDDGGCEYDIYTATLRLMTPFKYKADNSLLFLPNESLSTQSRYLWGNYFTTWAGGGIWGDFFNNDQIQKWNELTEDQRREAFELDECDCCSTYGVFFYNDVFFARENLFGLELDGFSAFSLANSSQSTPTNNTQNFELQNEGFLSNSENQVMILKIFGPTGTGLRNGDTIEIRNEQTKTGFKITFDDLEGEEAITIYTHMQDGIFDDDLIFIDPYTTNRYTLQTTSERSDTLLAFEPLYPVNYALERQDKINLSVSYSTISATARNHTIYYRVLPTFHI
jgi:hypothetical protein